MTENTSQTDLVPVSIERNEDNGIEITWNDGGRNVWTAGELRKACPCATCREKRRATAERKAAAPAMLPVLSAAEAQPLTIQSMQPVGSYAYNISFSDGHNSGIFTFALLRKQEASQ